MQNDEGQNMDLYIPRKCSATNRLITSKDRASVQINVGHLDQTGRYTGQFSTFALCGFIRAQNWYEGHLEPIDMGRHASKDLRRHGKLVPDRGNGSSSSQTHDKVRNFHFMPTPEVKQQPVVLKDGLALSVPDGGASLIEQVELQEMDASGHAV